MRKRGTYPAEHIPRISHVTRQTEQQGHMNPQRETIVSPVPLSNVLSSSYGFPLDKLSVPSVIDFSSSSTSTTRPPSLLPLRYDCLHRQQARLS